MTASFNTLIISDLHLGEDLSPSANEATSRHVDMVERQLVSFFEHYSRRRADGRPWRVVINGDMVDFMAITILPNQPEYARLVANRGHDDGEFGLRRTVNSSIAKVKMVGQRHAALFATMARFLARGHRIEIVCGNHDIEFHWRDVQAAFVDEIVLAYQGLPEAKRTGAATRDELHAGIEFHPWFFYEPGVAWIEHGHQYDENCAFDYGLNPLHPTDDEILSNVDTASTRYLTNYVREIDAHAQEDWSAMGYLKFTMSLGLRGSLRTARAYYSFSRALLSVRRSTVGPRARRLRRANHDLRREGLAERWQVEADALRAIDELRRTPVVSSIARLMRVLMLDKVVIFGAAALVAVAGFLALGAGGGSVAALSALLVATIVAWLFGRGRNVDPGEPLKVVPKRILRHIDAEYVVFGHTHKPVRMAIEGGTYFNTGTWIPGGKPGLLRAFTHVVIQHGPSGAKAELCQWRDGGSRPFNESAGEVGALRDVDARALEAGEREFSR